MGRSGRVSGISGYRFVKAIPMTACVEEDDVIVFRRIDDARMSGTSVTLSLADLELLWDMLSDQLGEAEAKYDKWRERFREYDHLRERDSETAITDDTSA